MVLDDKYVVTVIREAPYRGTLRISGGGKVLHWETVGLMYNALFGPDTDDVGSWQEIAERFIDSRK